MSMKWALGIWIVAIALTVAAAAALRRRREPPPEGERVEMTASAEAARDLKRVDELKVRRDELDRKEASEKVRLQTKNEEPDPEAALERLDTTARALVKSIRRGIPRQASQERVEEWLARMRSNLVRIAGLSDVEAETLIRKLEGPVTKWLGPDYYCSTYEEIAGGPAKGEEEILRAYHRISSASNDKDALIRDITAILIEAVGEEKARKLFVLPHRNESSGTEDSTARGMLTGLGLAKAAVDQYAPVLRETIRVEIEAGRLALNSRGDLLGTDVAMSAIEQAAAPALASCPTERLEQFNTALKNLLERARRERKQLIDVVEALRGTPK